MRRDKYSIAVALLAVLAVAFGLAGTLAPGSELVSPQSSSSSSSSDSVTHFVNPPTYDTNWMDIRNKTGQYFTLKHGLGTTEAVVDIRGKQRLDPDGGAPIWARTYGGAGDDYGYSLVQTSDGGYALGGYTDSFGAVFWDGWLVKFDSAGTVQWNTTYGGADWDFGLSLVQTSDGGYALGGFTYSFGAITGDGWLVKFDSAGNVQWNTTYGGAGGEQGWSLVQTSDGGYALGGWTGSFGAVGRDGWLVKFDSAGNVQWNTTYGGAGWDNGYSLVQTSDGGYALAGDTESFGAVGYDGWLVKFDSAGNVQWNTTYGGSGTDRCYSVVQTLDGGYALGGYTDSFGPLGADGWLVKFDSAGTFQWNTTIDGGAGIDVGRSLVQTFDGGYALGGYTDAFGTVGDDGWLVKFDSAGNAQWNTTYGGPGSDYCYSLVQTSDRGYALAGSTDSFAVSDDGWLVKLSGEMNLEHQRNIGGTVVVPGWSKTFGGVGDDYGYSLVQTSDGGYALGGETTSFGAAFTDGWLVKFDSAGTFQWNTTYGGAETDRVRSLVQTSDGGYALAGWTGSFGAVSDDGWLVKFDSDGTFQWNTTYGGAGTDRVYSVVQTLDGGYALGGGTMSFGAVTGDGWLVKFDSDGTFQWNTTYGGPSEDWGLSLVQTLDGGYALGGGTTSFGADGFDGWLVKFDSAGNFQWNTTYGGAGSDLGLSLVQTLDGGYALGGETTSFGAVTGDGWLVKFDSAGTVQWNTTYGGAGDDYGYSLVQTLDGGYALAGGTESFGADGTDGWLVKFDSAGNVQWDKTYGGADNDEAYSVVQTLDGGYALGGYTRSFRVLGIDGWLVKTDVENGLAWTSLTNDAITLYRGKTDPYWNYLRVRIWTIKEPTWMFGDINQDGIVDAKDLYIVSRNYGKTFSALSVTGIIAVTGVHAYKRRKKQPE